jgi:predicted GIY-YIG superfamily endonuclease
MPSRDRRFVYVLRSDAATPRYYVGLTDDPTRRVSAHNQGRSAHTSHRANWRVHVVIEFSTVEVAARFERYLKTGSGRAFAKRHFELPVARPDP